MFGRIRVGWRGDELDDINSPGRCNYSQLIASAPEMNDGEREDSGRKDSEGVTTELWQNAEGYIIRQKA